MRDRLLKNKYVFMVLLALIVLYPLRWTFTGLDLWDSGYNCANFVNFGPEFMTPKLFYSTFFATLLGHAFTFLPFGNTYAGLRFFCGLVICINVLISAVFCIRKLKMNMWVVAAGELLAVSLCYNPPPVLYNHLSFLLLNTAIIILYTGLTEDKDICLLTAGAVLSVNVFVRFPNITQAALIFAVWFFLFLKKSPVKEVLRKTVLCIGGYLAAGGLMLVIIGLFYGSGSYIAGIRGLFAMTGEASEYTPVSMVLGMFDSYIRGARRLADIVIFALAAVLVSCVVLKAVNGADDENIRKRIVTIISCVASVCLCVFFVFKKLMQFNFHHYVTVLLTAALFVDIMVLGALVAAGSKKAGDDERLISVMMILSVVVLSVGSNTAISPVMNCLFMAAPYMLHILMGFVKKMTAGYMPGKIKGMFAECFAIIFTISAAAFYIQCVSFGASYCYQEAENGAGGRYVVIDNPVIKGVRMDRARAEEIQDLTAYINEKGLVGSEVIIYGYCPGLAYYLGLTPAMTTWPDLESYGVAEMKEDMNELERKIDSSQAFMILANKEGINEQKQHNPDKWLILESFIKRNNYKTKDFGRYVIMEPKDQ